MKITGARSTTPARDTQRSDGARKAGAFTKVMQEAGTPPPPMGSMPVESAAAEAKAVRAVELPPALEGLVEEIGVNLQNSEVRIQFDAKTLDGLQVRIAREGGKLAVEMSCRSAETSRLLAQHVQGLSHALENRGYAGAIIEIRTASARPSPQQGRGGGQQERGQQGGRQK